MMTWLRGWCGNMLFPKPISFYRGVEVFRCRSDGQIATKKFNLEKHGGHYFYSPVILSLKEKFLIWIGVIE